MSVKPDGTKARDIAFYFFDKANLRTTRSIIAKTITQAKSLLKSGYTYDEIIKTIDYVIDDDNIKLYSLGYLNHVINVKLGQIKEKEQKEFLKQAQFTIKEVTENDTTNNTSKADRFGSKSRVGKKLNFDMFEEPR